MQIELKCPVCNSDMKEYVTRFICRNSNCKHEYRKFGYTTTNCSECDNSLCAIGDGYCITLDRSLTKHEFTIESPKDCPLKTQ